MPHELDAASRVPGVGVLCDGVEGLLLPVAANEDWQMVLQGRWIVPHPLGVVVDPAGGAFLLVQHLAHEVDRFVEPVEPLAEP